MRTALPLRLLFAVGLSLGLALLLLVTLYATNIAFEVYDHLRAAPLWFFALYVAGLGLLTAFGARLIWRVLVPRRRRRRAREADSPPPPTEAEVRGRIERAVAAGAAAEAEAARQELDELAARREAGQIHVALLGPVSTGKSSLVRALLPEATTAVSPVGGTTREVTRYTWQSPAGDQLILSDLPGLLEADGTLDRLAREEALRAHLVVYLIDGDLTRDQLTALHEVLA
ncbi:MAG: 50S ribosome-binding GTPase, partial [Gammaproteobacteria bacterium]|nr:50S ribosome-binding GTPase [Gammaproteobacteria bacterium]